MVKSESNRHTSSFCLLSLTHNRPHTHPVGITKQTSQTDSSVNFFCVCVCACVHFVSHPASPSLSTVCSPCPPIHTYTQTSTLAFAFLFLWFLFLRLSRRSRYRTCERRSDSVRRLSCRSSGWWRT